MKKLYHYGRKQRQLKWRIKRFKNAIATGDKRLAFELIARIKDLIGFANLRLLKKAIAVGAILSVPLNGSAQEVLFQSDTLNLDSLNLYPWDFSVPDTFTNHPYNTFNFYGKGNRISFMDIDDDGDEDAFYSVQHKLSYPGSGYHQNLNLLFFQENAPADSHTFEMPQLLWYTYSQDGPLPVEVTNFDGDGDWDLIVNSWESFFVLENVSGQPDSFDIRLDAIVPSNSNSRFFYPDLVDLDGDMDDDMAALLLDSTEMEFNLYYRENDGSNSRFPFGNNWIPSGTPLSLMPFGNYPYVYRVAADFMDLDEDGHTDMLIQADFEEEDLYDPYNYYPKERRLLFYPNRSEDGFEFDATGIQLIESDLRNGDHEYYTGENSFFNFADIDKDGDKDVLELKIVTNIICGYCGTQDYYRGISYYENITGEPVLRGTAFADLNSNGARDPGELPIQHVSIRKQPEGLIRTTGPDGKYYFFSSIGDQSIKVLYETSLWNIVPAGHEISLDSLYTIDSLDFAFQPVGSNSDLKINVVERVFRRGFNSRYTIGIRNLGPPLVDPSVQVVLDDGLEFVSSTLPAVANGDTLSIALADLEAFGYDQFDLKVYVSLDNVLGDTLFTTFTALPVESDVQPDNNVWTAAQIIRGSSDPNDKSVSPQGQGEDGSVPPSTDLFTYTIRFQNVGNDTAFFVKVLDTLDQDLDLETFQMIAASHSYDFTLTAGGIATWTFHNILLPDSSADLSGSEGFIQYSIRPVEESPVGAVFTNFADIYFDFNNPVRTNTTINTFDITLGRETPNQLTPEIYPNPASDRVEVRFDVGNERARFELYQPDGKLLLIEESYDERLTIQRKNWPAGAYNYFISVGNKQGSGNIVFD